MTEQQAEQIIDLLKQILDKMTEKTAYDLHDIHSEIGSVKSAIDDVERAVGDVKNAINNLDIG